MRDRLVLWGKNPILEALRSDRDIEKIYIAHDSHPSKGILELAREKGIKVQRVSRRKVEELAGTKKTQGIVALMSPVDYVPPRELFEETVSRNSFFITLDHITDPQNVGNLIRTCEVLGGVGVLLPKDRSAPINETVVKASSGAIFHLMVARVPSLVKALKGFKRMGGWVFVIEKGGRDIRDLEIATPCVLVLGAEDKGVSRSVIEISDEVLSIPMWGRTGSLNVGSAGAIAMWEVVRGMRKTT